MDSLRQATAVCASVVIFVLLNAAPGRSDVTIGTPDLGGANGAPFQTGIDPNPGFPSNRYQQVYAASGFPGPITITGITFFDTQEWIHFPMPTFESADFTFSFSTSKFTVNNLDTSNFDNNVGSNAQLFASLRISGILTSQSFTISGSPFTYDPSKGDLLLDVTRANWVFNNSAVFFDSMDGDSGGLFSRVDNYGTGFDNFGLVTRFDTVPEPSTLALLTIGTIGLLFARRRFVSAVVIG